MAWYRQQVGRSRGTIRAALPVRLAICQKTGLSCEKLRVPGHGAGPWLANCEVLSSLHVTCAIRETRYLYM